MNWRCLTLTIVFGCASLRSPAAEDDPFASKVTPILKRHCLKCHGTKVRAGLNLSSMSSTLIGARSGPVIVPGNPSQSLLIQVLAKESDPHMPPRGQLTPEEIAILSRWIEQLPKTTPVGAQAKRSSDHWAFQPIQRPSIPSVQNPSILRSPIDAFVLSRLEKEELSFSPQAAKETLIRRLYFDLIGLPPTLEEINAFATDPSPDAYEGIVDRLLASPRYGERWGRHWLDLARYADSSGFHQDFDRPSAWRYRDYVIDSFNQDKPYAQFITEQLAGDLIPDSTAQSWIATGFCRNGPSNDDNMGKGLAKVRYRYDQLDDIVATTSNVFLGLTIGCARCHDHKYDPLTQRDYYQFLAFFNSAEPKRLVLDQFQAAKPSLKPHTSKKDKWSPISARVLTDRGQKVRATHILWRGDVRNQGPKVTVNVPSILRSKSTTQRSRLTLARWISDVNNPLTWRVMANRIWAHHFGRGLVATPSNFGKQGERPTHPRLLDWLAIQLRGSGGSMKALHRKIVTSATYRQSSTSTAGAKVDPKNHLLWRMSKRRLEAEPLRDTILHLSGQLNLTMGGPGIKPRVRPELLNASQRNKWPVVKKEGPQHWRRSVYVYVKRQLQYPMLELFDAPSTTHSCARRNKSMVPTQALVLMNDEFVHDQARYFAARVIREVGQSREAQVQQALKLALGKTPSQRRILEGARFLQKQAKILRLDGFAKERATLQALADFCQVLMNLSELVYVE